MNKKILYIMFVSSCGLFLFVSCAPKLATIPYSQEELVWKNYIQNSYSNWEPVENPPFYEGDNNIEENSSTIKIVPDAIENTKVQSKSNDKILLLNDKSTKDISTQSYIVKKGDTLWNISKKFYGTPNKWKIIEQANKDKISKNNFLKPGIVLTIPAQ